MKCDPHLTGLTWAIWINALIGLGLIVVAVLLMLSDRSSRMLLRQLRWHPGQHRVVGDDADHH